MMKAPDAPPQEDFYKAPLFQTKTNKSKIETWKLLTPVAPTKKTTKKTTKKIARLADTSTEFELAQDLFGPRSKMY
jgi:hypothetical protein